MDKLITFHWFRGGDVEWRKVSERPSLQGQVEYPGVQWWLSNKPDQSYEPLRDELALFRAFADIEPSTENIGDFARDYGTLLREAKRLDPSGYGEPINLWGNEIHAMRCALTVWEAKPRRLEELIRFEPSRCMLWLEDGRQFIEIASAENRPQLWRRLKDGTLSKARRLQLAALFYVQNVANTRLAAHVAPRLLFDPEAGNVELTLRPRNLLGALWLQLSRAVEGEKEYRRCIVCTKWFEVSPEGMRPEAKQCSPACRMRAYRKRKKEQKARPERATRDKESTKGGK